MRKLMMTATMLLVAASFVLAQPGRGQRGQNRADLYSELNLTPAQQEKIKTIRMEAREKAKATEKSPGTRPDRESMRKMKEETGKAMEAVLTPAQREQLIKLKAERKAALQSVDKQAIQSELKQHHANQVAPVLKAARGQLNQFISAEDQASLERLRGVFADKPGADRMGKAGKAGQERSRPTEEEMAAKKAEHKAWREAHAADISELKALTTKSQADLERVQQRLQPEMDKWAKERQEIVKSHLPEDAPAHAGKRGEHKPQQGHGKKSGEGRQGWPKASAFLLMRG